MYKIGIIEDLDDSFNDYKEIFEDDEIELIRVNDFSNINELHNFIIDNGIEAIIIDYKLKPKFNVLGTEIIAELNKIMPDFIKLCNPEWNENISENVAFLNALKLADEFWEIYIKHAIAEVEAIEIILEKIDNCKECYLIFDVEMPYRKAIKYINTDKVKYIIFKSRREGFEIRTLIDSFKFKNEIVQATDINIARELTGINDLIYIDVHGKLCCTRTLESAIQIIKYNEE